MTSPIGGYFELDLPVYDNLPLAGGAKVNSGRNAMEYILRSIGSENIGTVYLPYYTCNVVLEPLQRLGINFQFYHVDRNLEICEPPKLKEHDYIIANNYFGIKDRYMDKCIDEFGERLIIDASQSLYYPARPEVKIFYSPRKFVALPDGGIAFAPNSIEIAETDESWDLCSHMLKRIDMGANGGYQDFHANSAKLKGRPLRAMSRLTRRMLQSIDFQKVRESRKRNYDALRETLEATNLLSTPSSSEVACPMVYPYLTDDTALRQRLIDNKIFVARYWPNVLEWCTPKDTEYNLTTNILPLPIDQRYGEEDMERIVDKIKSNK